MRQTHEQVADRIASSFQVPIRMEPHRAATVDAKLRHARPEYTRPRGMKYVLVGLALTVSVSVAVLGGLPHQAPSSALAQTAAGLQRLEDAGLVHFRQETTTELHRGDGAVRRSVMYVETWIDNEKGLRRTDVQTKAHKGQSSVEALRAHSVSKNGVTQGWQTDLLNGEQETRSTNAESERNWPDDFDGAIASLRDSLNGPEKHSGVQVELVGEERIDNEPVLVIRRTDLLSDPEATIRDEDVMTFWLRKCDYVPLRIECLRVETRDGKREIQLRSTTRITSYEILPQSMTDSALFDFTPHPSAISN